MKRSDGSPCHNLSTVELFAALLPFLGKRFDGELVGHKEENLDQLHLTINRLELIFTIDRSAGGFGLILTSVGELHDPR